MVQDNFIRGNLSVPFRGLSLLDALVLNNNLLSGTIPERLLLNNPRLGVFNVGWNNLTGTLPLMLGGMEQLSYLELHHNRFSGTIPESIGNASRLQLIDVSSNQLRGTVPSTLYSLTRLDTLALGNNTNVTGAIDTRLGQMTTLARIYVGDTHMFGTIPDEIYTRLTSLTHLIMNNAGFAGPLKEDVRLLNATLLSLELNDNILTGPLPAALDYLTALESLYLGGNSFTGTISSAVCDQRGLGPQKLSKLFADCQIECGCNDNATCKQGLV